MKLRISGIVTACWMALLSSCSVWPGGSGNDGWKKAIETQAGQLGYGNWIVIAESSFPAYSRSGIRQVNAYRPIPEVLDEVLTTLERTEHVRPRIYTTREMRVVENDFAPGMDVYREDLKKALHAYPTTELDQDSLTTLIKDAQKSYDILVIRTTTALPYSSVFLELRHGYWDGESEQHLRQKMRNVQP